MIYHDIPEGSVVKNMDKLGYNFLIFLRCRALIFSQFSKSKLEIYRNYVYIVEILCHLILKMDKFLFCKKWDKILAYPLG